jgi:hypothetical protein
MIRKINTLLCLIILAQLTAIGQTSGPLQWTVKHSRPTTITMGTPPLEACNNIKALSSGNVITVGYTTGGSPIAESDLYIRKIDKSTGAILNESFIDFYGGERTDVAVKVLIAEPYVYVIGTSTFTSSPFDKDIVVIKTDTSLNTIWTRNINNTGNPDDVAVDAGLDIFGNLYVLGNTTRTTTGGDILLRKYNSSGTVLFTKFYTSTGGNYSDAATALAVEPNGVCNITGYYNSGTLGTRLLALKVWSNGAQLWAKYHDVTTGAVRPDEGSSVSYDPVSGDVFVCGRGQNSLGNYDWVVVRFAGSDGTKLWNKKYIGTSNNNDAGIGVIYTSAGELYTSGNIRTAVSGIESNNIQLRKLDPSNGATIWNKTYNFQNGPDGPSNDVATTMLVSPSGTIYIGGYIYFQTPTYVAPYHLVLSYNSSGVQQWAHMEFTSGAMFQGLNINSLAYSTSENAVFAAGYDWATVSLNSNSVIIKLGPASITAPIAIRSNLDQDDFKAPIVYPNPAQDFIYLKRFDQSEGHLQIFDMSGKIVFSQLLQEEISSIDISTFPSGLYLARYSCNENSETLRFVKE